MQIQNALQEQYDVILDRKTSNGGENRIRIIYTGRV